MKKLDCHKSFELVMKDLSFNGKLPAGLDTTSPKLATYLSQTNHQFNKYIHNKVDKTWVLSPLEFPLFSGNFYFYVPKSWDEVRVPVEGNCASFFENGIQRQTIFLLDIESWRQGIDTFLKESNVLGYATFNFGHVAYNNLTFVTEPKNSTAPYWVWSAFTAGDWIVLMKGDADSPEMLNTQLVSLINSCPWLTWLKSAMACG